MPEPTNHRAEAEKWLEEFRSVTMDVRAEPRDMLLLAEIHALLALSDPKPSTFTIRPGLTTAVTGGNPAAPSESQRCIARHDGLRCVFWAGHKDPHRGTWTDE